MKNEPKREYKTLASRALEHSCSDFTIGYRVHSSGWPVRIAALHDAVESARSVGAHYEDDNASREVGL
jgi:hypothetical protein